MAIRNTVRLKYLLFFYICLILLSVFLYNCSAPSRISELPLKKSNLEVLRDNISYLISDPNLFNAQVGVYIESIDRGESIFAHNEHKLFISASNMKIFTTAVSLLNLGPNFRYKTPIYYSGTIKNGVLYGDIVIQGSGDPTIAPRFSNGDSRLFFRAWTDSIVAKGITQIDGDIIGDESYFQTEPLGYGWQWDDLPFWYAAQISALSFNDNCIDVSVVADNEIGKAPSVDLSPPTNYFTIDNSAIITGPDSVRTLYLTRPRLQNILQVRNKIPINKPKYEESISVEDPAKFFVTVFKEVLNEEGIKVQGGLKTVKESGAINYDKLYFFVFLFTL